MKFNYEIKLFYIIKITCLLILYTGPVEDKFLMLQNALTQNKHLLHNIFFVNSFRGYYLKFHVVLHIIVIIQLVIKSLCIIEETDNYRVQVTFIN